MRRSRNPLVTVGFVLVSALSVGAATADDSSVKGRTTIGTGYDLYMCFTTQKSKGSTLKRRGRAHAAGGAG
jgi:hypothetical protein